MAHRNRLSSWLAYIPALTGLRQSHHESAGGWNPIVQSVNALVTTTELQTCRCIHGLPKNEVIRNSVNAGSIVSIGPQSDWGLSVRRW